MANMSEKLKHIALTYGYESQSRQLVEEMAELTVALNKVWRGKDVFSASAKKKAWKNVIEEIADVENMLEQIKFLLHCDSEVFLARTKKADRTMERMKANEKA